MKLLSEACEYGLRSVVWLAGSPDEPQKVKDIAHQIQAAPGYLVKVLQDLTRAGILAARRGSNGGFTLLSDPAKLTALDVINAIDPLERIHSCPLAKKSHSHNLCPIHHRIDNAVAQIEESFREITIAEVVESDSLAELQCGRLRPECSVQVVSAISESETDSSIGVS